MRLVLSVLFVLAMGLGLGGAMSWFSIQDNVGFGALRIGSWTAWPLAGDAAADPYTKAKVAADGEVPLGAAEGLAFHAERDDAGAPLRRQCNYRLSGYTPPARLWTLTPHSLDNEALRQPGGRVASLSSQDVVRGADGALEVAVGPKLRSGNWLPVEGVGPFQLIMRIYDTPVTGTRGIADPKMPAITLAGCAS